jgi:outer membrane protein assembly factor BamB
MAQATMIFVGISGTVVALDRSTGAEVWRSDLKGNDFVNVALQDGDLYATAKGELFCLGDRHYPLAEPAQGVRSGTGHNCDVRQPANGRNG